MTGRWWWWWGLLCDIAFRHWSVFTNPPSHLYLSLSSSYLICLISSIYNKVIRETTGKLHAFAHSSTRTPNNAPSSDSNNHNKKNSLLRLLLLVPHRLFCLLHRLDSPLMILFTWWATNLSILNSSSTLIPLYSNCLHPHTHCSTPANDDEDAPPFLWEILPAAAAVGKMCLAHNTFFLIISSIRSYQIILHFSTRLGLPPVKQIKYTGPWLVFFRPWDDTPRLNIMAPNVWLIMHWINFFM